MYQNDQCCRFLLLPADDESVANQEDPVASLVYKSCMSVVSFVRACSDLSF